MRKPDLTSTTVPDEVTQNDSLERGLEDAQPRRLVVIEGPDTGKVFELDPMLPTRLLLGTSTTCGARLTDPMVSRRHAAFEPSGARYRVTDLGSTNGTVIDGTAITDAFIRGGEVIRCGNTAMRVDEDVPADVSPLPNAIRFGCVLGGSVAMRRLYGLCHRLARAPVPVIIEGETGTGKENLAEALHQVSGRTGPFVVFDCTAIAPGMMEAELFGHERGAFTGAVSDRPGLFEEAEGGTVLIDEIGDLELPLQAKLLRVIDRSEFRRIGGRKTLRMDVRVIAATRRDLDREVAAGRFRDDLLHRLAVARIELPPLRERKGDVVLLARHFAEQMGHPQAVSSSMMARFADYAWPGNVRELRNSVARCIALGEEEIELGTHRQARSDVPSTNADAGADWLERVIAESNGFPEARRRMLEAFERFYIDRMLAEHDGSVSRAAQASGIAVRYFHMIKARSKS